MQHRATIRSQMLYDCIDASDNFYQYPINPAHRSQMNVVYKLPTPELEKAFLEQETVHKLMHLSGHRIVGGIRASLYNAMPLEGVETLVNFIVQGLVDHPDDVRVRSLSKDSATLLELYVNPVDKDLVIGTDGETLQHIRAVLDAASGSRKTTLEMVDAHGGASAEE